MISENSRDNLQKLFLRAAKGILPYWLKFPQNLDWYNYVKNLEIDLQVIYTTVVLENQVNNGGFDQYFVNFYGQFVFITIDNLIRIKAMDKAKILNEALTIHNPKNHSEKEFVAELVSNDWLNKMEFYNIKEKIKILDRKYSQSSDDILSLLENYTKQEGPK